jgi:hypothetical protein
VNNPENRFKFELDYEIGFTGVIFHTIQFGQTGTVLNYEKDGGQNILFLYQRYTAGLSIGKHTVYFLYQPLRFSLRFSLRAT